MTSEEEWHPGELARAISRLTTMVEKLDEKLDGLGRHYVPRETFEMWVSMATANQTRLETAEKRVEDLATQMITKRAVVTLITVLATVFLAYATWVANHP